MSFHEQLFKLRKEKGLSQENLANILGISRQAVAKWESGSSYPDIAKLISLSGFFDVTIDKLVNDFEENCTLHINKESVDTNHSDLIDFIIESKKSTYANFGLESPASRPNSHDLHYERGTMKYIDTYIGGTRFIGEEGVWINNIPKWGMNYSGRVIHPKFSGDFLKKALINVPCSMPYRGPALFKSGQFTYHCSVEGTFQWFSGCEEIFYEDTKVYECKFHGGIIE